MNPVKLIVTHKANLQWKYGSNFSKINAMLKKLKDADKKKMLDTKIVFIDDDASTKAAGVKKIKVWSEQECKRIVLKIVVRMGKNGTESGGVFCVLALTAIFNASFAFSKPLPKEFLKLPIGFAVFEADLYKA